MRREGLEVVPRDAFVLTEKKLHKNIQLLKNFIALVEELRDDDSLRQYVLNYVSDQLPNIMIPNDDWENYNSRVKVASEQQRRIQNFEQLHKSAKAKAFSEYAQHIEALNTIDKIAEILEMDLKVSYQTKYGRKTFVEKYSRIERSPTV